MRIFELEHRRVAIWGFGKEGQAVYQAIRAELPELRLTILCTEADAEIVESMNDPRVVCTIHVDEEVLSHYDYVLKSPGISPYKPMVEAAKERGTVFTSGTALWFAEHAGDKTLCVTGTKGKSTSTALLAHLLRAAGKHVGLVGNIGMPLVEMMRARADYWAIELSSFQTTEVAASGMRPHLALVTNVIAEHLDWHGDEATYVRDKLALLTAAKPHFAILNAQDANLTQLSLPNSEVHWFNHPEGWHLRDNHIYRGDEKIIDVSKMPLPGVHNRGNLCGVLLALEVLGFDARELAFSALAFKPLPHRLQSMGVKDGIEYVNDSISTTPNTALAALDVYANKKVAIILGGHDRGLDWYPFADALATQAPAVIITMGANGPRINAIIRRVCMEQGVVLQSALSLADAVDKARAALNGEGVVLMSPGAPSFGLYKDYVERGKDFAQIAGFDPERVGEIPGQGVL